jgi:hypothetical protein
VELLRELYPEAPVFSMPDFESACDESLSTDAVLLLPHMTCFPMESWDALVRFLESGGKAVMLGRRPFEARVRSVDGRPEPQTIPFDKLAQEAIEVEGLSSVQLWRHMNESGVMRGSARVATSPKLPWPGVEVDVVAFEDWDTMSAEGLQNVDMPAGANSLVFFARGGKNTSRIAVVCEERDGSVWSHVIQATDAWQRHVVHEGKFRYFHGGHDRGGEGDRLSITNASKISVGLSMHLAPQVPGDHTFGLSDVRVAVDPRSVKEVVSWPDLLLLSPPYRRYEFTANTARSLRTGEPLGLKGVPAASPLQRPRGMGGDRSAPFRWVPLFEAVNKSTGGRGWPASLCVVPAGEGVAQTWGWIGVDPTAETVPAVQAMVRECVRRLQGGAFLAHGGCDRFTFGPRDVLSVSAGWVVNAAHPPRTRVVAELMSKDGVRLRRVLSSPDAVREVSRHTKRVQLNLGRCPEPEEDTADYTVRIMLEGSGVAGRILDVIEQPIKVVAADREVDSAQWLDTTGSRFTLTKLPVYLLGVNYWPQSVNGRAPGEHGEHWLEPGAFDPEMVRRDLDLLRSGGVNALAVQYLAETQGPQLQFFADECRQRGMRIVAFLPHVSPLGYDLEGATALITAAELTKEPQVFALDLAWEPILGSAPTRRRFDEAWQRWLIEQYGSVEHAEDVIGRPLWRRGSVVTGPPDDELSKNGDHRVAVAVYRRFVDDYVSRRYGYIKRFLEEQGCKQLLTARTGYGGTGNPWADPYFPLDLGSGAVHLDFISPEGWDLSGPLERFHEAAFLAVYARGVSGGKPVVWLEFGSSVGVDPASQDLANQARVYQHMFDLIERSGSAGGFAWWFPSGYRVDEGSEMGVVNPDGSWRPVGEVYRTYARRLRREMKSPRSWRGRQVVRSADARGVSALWDRWRDTYREETAANAVEELRPRGFGQSTVEMPVHAVGGMDVVMPAPLECANAEWGYIRVNNDVLPRPPGERITVRMRDRMDLELINTGVATWAASEKGKERTVWVRAEHPERKPLFLRVDKVPWGAHADIAWIASSPGLWQLRPYIQSLGAFGEMLEVEVLAEE